MLRMLARLAGVVNGPVGDAAVVNDQVYGAFMASPPLVWAPLTLAV